MKIGTFFSLALKRDFKNLNRNGNFVPFKPFYFKYIHASENRVAFLIKKKLGNAPKRNLIKRRCREIIRKIPQQMNQKSNIHCFIIARAEIFDYSFKRLSDEIFKAIERTFR